MSVPDSVMTVGHAPECDLVLPDEEVALDHLEIRLGGGALHFHDLGSMSGTLVNQVEVREGRLKHGDVIEVGRTRLLVEAHVQAEVPVRPFMENAPSRGRKAALGVACILLAAFGLWRWTGRADVSLHHGDALKNASVVPVAEATENPAGSEHAPTAQAETEGEIAAAVEPPVTDEIRRLRSDIESLRETITSWADEWISAVSSDARATENENAITAQALLLRARSEMDQGRVVEADRLLAGLQILAPSFAEAWAERAGLMEARGRLAEAEAEWRQMRDQVDDPKWVARAEKELERIGRLRWEQEAAFATVSIAGLTHRKFPARESLDEMRTLTVRLVPDEPHMRPNPSDVAVEVAFFDREQPAGSIMPSPRVPPVLLHPDGAWEAGQPVDLVATYRVDSTYPDGWLLNRREDGIAYFGCRVRLFVRGEMVSEVFRPMVLADIPVAIEAAAVQHNR